MRARAHGHGTARRQRTRVAGLALPARGAVAGTHGRVVAVLGAHAVARAVVGANGCVERGGRRQRGFAHASGGSGPSGRSGDGRTDAAVQAGPARVALAQLGLEVALPALTAVGYAARCAPGRDGERLPADRRASTARGRTVVAALAEIARLAEALVLPVLLGQLAQAVPGAGLPIYQRALAADGGGGPVRSLRLSGGCRGGEAVSAAFPRPQARVQRVPAGASDNTASAQATSAREPVITAEKLGSEAKRNESLKLNRLSCEITGATELPSF